MFNSIYKLNPDQRAIFASLPPVLRILLISDGTITSILEAWFNEPIVIQCQQQMKITTTDELSQINVRKGDEILQRQVNLVGKDTGQSYLVASSYIRLNAFQGEIISDFLQGQTGIGSLLEKHRIERYREILNICLDDAPVDTASRVTTKIMSRSYRIFVQNNPCIVVTEKFPFRVYL